MENKPLLYRFIKVIVTTFFRKRKYIGIENLPNEACLVIGNHAQMNGPLASECYYPRKNKTWCIGQMMNIKEAPSYSYDDFWPNKNWFNKPIYKVLSYIISPIMVYVLSKADTIAVYKDSRIITTFKHTVEELANGNHIIVFPENPNPYNEILNDFQDKYIDIAKLYYKKYGKLLNFVPMYNCPDLKKLVIGKPIQFNPDMDMAEQRLSINNYLKNEITTIAKDLPRHKVYPYANIRKKNYPMSKDE
jgi:hypothetical protein